MGSLNVRVLKVVACLMMPLQVKILTEAAQDAEVVSLLSPTHSAPDIIYKTYINTANNLVSLVSTQQSQEFSHALTMHTMGRPCTCPHCYLIVLTDILILACGM
jgi:hypothetical protein